jgi:hypothetical protein
VDQIRGFTYDGVAIGEHAIAGAIRFFASTYLERTASTNESCVATYHAAILTALAVRKLMRAHRFDASLFHHGIYVPQGLIGEVARQENVRVVNWHVAYRKKCFLFSHGNTYHHTLMDEPTAIWDQVPWTEALERRLLDYTQESVEWRGRLDSLQPRSTSGGGRHRSRGRYRLQQAMHRHAHQRDVGRAAALPDERVQGHARVDAEDHRLLLAASRFAAPHPSAPRRDDRQDPLPSANRRRDPEDIPQVPPNVFVVPPESKISTYAAMFQCNAVIIYARRLAWSSRRWASP